MKPEKDKCTWSYKNDEYKKMTRNKNITMDELWKWWQSSQTFEIKLFKIVSRVSEKWRQPTLPICPLLLAVLLVEFPPLFHSVTGHSEYCWELSWDWELDCIAVSNELMVSSVEGIPKNITYVYVKSQNTLKSFSLYSDSIKANMHLLSTCANAQNGPLGQYPVWRMSLHLVDL